MAQQRRFLDLEKVNWFPLNPRIECEAFKYAAAVWNPTWADLYYFQITCVTKLRAF